MIYYLLLSCALTTTQAEKFFQIDDIPIEHFGHEDIQNDAIDVELMPRSTRSFQLSSNYHPNYHTDQGVEGLFENIPAKPEGVFDRYFAEIQNLHRLRSKREVSGKSSLNVKDPLKLVSELGKPLELAVIETDDENATKLPDANANMLINDFIRFRRSTAEQNGNAGGVADGNRPDTEQKSSHLHNPLKNFSHVVVTPPKQKDVSRETRGITRDQWVRHSYPVRRDEMSYDDNIQEPSDSAPRVHFVTEGMTGVLTGEKKYDREARARSLNEEISRNLARDSVPEMDYIQPRYTRNYDTWSPRLDRYQEQRDPYPYRKPYNPYERSDSRYNPSPSRQKRIIYYATLPEVPRPSPKEDYRDRYAGYRDRYDDFDYRDRYYEPYRYRQGFFKRPSFEDDRKRKTELPVRVSTDLNIRDVKKNPERIYSDVTRSRYNGDDMY